MSDPTAVAISSFFGPYRFLSNFEPCNVVLDEEIYPSVEHAYQAAKTLDPAERQMIRDAASAGAAKRLGKKGALTITLRSDWNDVRISVMRDLVRQKFQDPRLKQLLLDTGCAELIEGNTWGDMFWGQCDGKGHNHLGRLLMELRDEEFSRGILQEAISSQSTHCV